MKNVAILMGAQWGDEGKGKWVDALARDADLVVRFQGGNNAGHTLYVGDQKVVLHHIPSGIFHERCRAVLAAGVVVNPTQLVEEIKHIEPFVKIEPSRLAISARAHVITPWHIHLDTQREETSAKPIGTTKKGIGPTYSAKSHRSGLRMGYFVNQIQRQAWIETMKQECDGFNDHFQRQKAAWDTFAETAERLAPLVSDTEHEVRAAIRNGAKVLLEGAQGALLDIDHGTYPYVTSSSTVSGGAFQSIGFPVHHVGQVLGIAKAYVTRVGEGPFPTELKDENGAKLAKLGNEFGATTGRPRRCGWLDLVALRYAYQSCGLTGLILNKADILDAFSEIKVCTGYILPDGSETEIFPWDPQVLAAVKPVYKTFKGWAEPLPKSGDRQTLPKEAQEYASFVEEYLGGPVRFIGTGAGRTEAIHHSGPAGLFE